MNMNKGFTLIETIIYIALFTILMGGALATAYSLIEGADGTQTKTTVQEEANFVLRKIDWALTGTETINIPGAGYSDILSVSKYDGTNIVIQLTSGKIEISEDGGATFLPITTDNVAVGTLQFYHIPALGSGPEGIQASITIS